MELSLFKKEGKPKEEQKPSPIYFQPKPQVHKQQSQQSQQFIMMRQQLTEVIRILRTLEDRYNNLIKKVQLTDQNMLQEHKRLNKELKIVDSDLIDAKKELNELDYKFGLIVKELEVCAKKQDVNLIKKYIELWQPMDFIRKKDADKLVDRMLKDKIKKKEKVL